MRLLDITLDKSRAPFPYHKVLLSKKISCVPYTLLNDCIHSLCVHAWRE